MHLDTLMYFDGKKYFYLYGKDMESLREKKEIIPFYKKLLENPELRILRLDICLNCYHNPNDEIDIMKDFILIWIV